MPKPFSTPDHEANVAARTQSRKNYRRVEIEAS